VRPQGMCLASGVRSAADRSLQLATATGARMMPDECARWAFRQRVVRIHVDWSFVSIVQGPSAAISLDGQLGEKRSDDG